MKAANVGFRTFVLVKKMAARERETHGRAHAARHGN
jgi:hypothetical protein